MTTVPKFLNIILQCGVFILVPSSTFGIGYWLIRKHWRDNKTLSLFAGAGLWGFVAFEITLIGILFDPETIYPLEWGRFIWISSIIGVGTFLFVLVVTSIVSSESKA